MLVPVSCMHAWGEACLSCRMLAGVGGKRLWRGNGQQGPPKKQGNWIEESAIFGI